MRTLAMLLACSASLSAQQIVDTAFVPAPDGAPAFAQGRGPLIVIDEAHHNFHTASGRYRPFAQLLERDGFVIRSNTASFDSATLSGVRVLVIANAVGERNREQA